MTGMTGSSPALPGLASAVNVAVGARAGSRVARAAIATLSALGEARLGARRTLAARARHLSTAMREICTIHAIDVSVDGMFPDRPCVLVANHVSYLDPIMILAHAPAAPISKAEVEGWPMIGPCARALGVNFVDRSSVVRRAVALRRAVTTLRAGVSVLNFPEGTTTRGTRLLPFHRGIFGAAMIADVPVVPIAVTYDDVDLAWTDNETFLPHYWRLSTRTRARARLVVRAPMWARPTEEPEDFAARCRAAIALSLDGHLRS
jgi:1-acyl-sn-glycerol-3-phosphate acyltransferase